MLHCEPAVGDPIEVFHTPGQPPLPGTILAIPMQSVTGPSIQVEAEVKLPPCSALNPPFRMTFMTDGQIPTEPGWFCRTLPRWAAMVSASNAIDASSVRMGPFSEEQKQEVLDRLGKEGPTLTTFPVQHGSRPSERLGASGMGAYGSDKAVPNSEPKGPGLGCDTPMNEAGGEPQPGAPAVGTTDNPCPPEPENPGTCTGEESAEQTKDESSPS